VLERLLVIEAHAVEEGYCVSILVTEHDVAESCASMVASVASSGITSIRPRLSTMVWPAVTIPASW